MRRRSSFSGLLKSHWTSARAARARLDEVVSGTAGPTDARDRTCIAQSTLPPNSRVDFSPLTTCSPERCRSRRRSNTAMAAPVAINCELRFFPQHHARICRRRAIRSDVIQTFLERQHPPGGQRLFPSPLHDSIRGCRARRVVRGSSATTLTANRSSNGVIQDMHERGTKQAALEPRCVWCRPRPPVGTAAEPYIRSDPVAEKRGELRLVVSRRRDQLRYYSPPDTIEMKLLPNDLESVLYSRHFDSPADRRTRVELSVARNHLSNNVGASTRRPDFNAYRATRFHWRPGRNRRSHSLRGTLRLLAPLSWGLTRRTA